MERTFDTPKPVRLTVENESGPVTVAAVAGATTSVSVRAETPGGEELVENTTIECRPSGGTHTVVVKVRANAARASCDVRRSRCTSSCRRAVTSPSPRRRPTSR